MKTFTVTYHHTTNYGALFQALALQRSIINLGHENILFEYTFPKKKKKVFEKSVVKSLRNVYSRICYRIHRRELRRLAQSFTDFHSKLILTKPYASMDEFRSDLPEADAYITGSDQVWNLNSSPRFLQAKILDFGPEDKIRFSYAASIERLNYSDQQKAMMARQLSKYKGIALREESARAYVQEFSGLPCIRTIDPVFLLTQEEWSAIGKAPRIEGPYILTYQVQSHPLMQHTVDRLKEQTGLPVVSICNGAIRYVKADYTFRDVSPEEFLGLYQHAGIVVSASFHGTAFGLIFGKPTYALARKDTGNRVKDLCKMFGLEDFVVVDKSTLASPTIDKARIEESIVREREFSLSYLKSMLSR